MSSIQPDSPSTHLAALDKLKEELQKVLSKAAISDPYSDSPSDSPIDQVGLAHAMTKWKSIVEGHDAVPKALLFVLSCSSWYDEEIIAHYEGLLEGCNKEALASMHSLQRLSESLGFKVSLGNLTLSLAGKASTDTIPRWNPYMDDWDEDDLGKHAMGVWLERDDIDDSSISWKFTQVGNNGNLDLSQQQELGTIHTINHERDWMPDQADLRDVDNADYDEWDGPRNSGETGELRVEGFHTVGLLFTLL